MTTTPRRRYRPISTSQQAEPADQAGFASVAGGPAPSHAPDAQRHAHPGRLRLRPGIAPAAAALLVAVLVLGACGSGGGSSISDTGITNPTVVSSSAGTEASSPTSDATAGSTTTAAPSTTVAKVANPDCTLVTPDEINQALGYSVGAPTKATNGPVTVCTYDGGGHALIRFQINQSQAAYQSAKAKFAQNGFTAHDLAGFGDAAYWATQGTDEVTLVVLKGTTELLIVGQPSTLTKVEALANKILPSL